MGEAVLGAFLKVLLEKLTHRDVRNYFGRLKKVDQKKLKKWTTTLIEIEEVLDHAEEKQLMKQQGVKMWLDDLRDLAYDVEDILDEFSTEMLRLRIKELNGATPSKLRMPFSNFKFNLNLNSEIKELNDRLLEICQRKDQFGLHNDRLLEICQRKDQFGLHKIGTSSTKEWKIPPSSCQPSGSVIGREEDKRKIVEFLSKEELSSTLNFHVVAIVGMPGVGKTTLAGDVFNDTATQQFYPKGWVSVSDDFDIVRLTKEILQYVTPQTCNLEPFSKAQEELMKILRGKKFLIVLDDVWVKHDYDLHDLWTRLQSPFSVGAPGSKILVTTRDKNVAKIMGASEVHSLECVSEDHCLEIFEQHAFGNRINSGRPPNFEILKTKIAGKCGGLPLAARTLGGILCYKNVDEWEALLNNELWSLFAKTNSHILPVLKLSYHYLPSKLKRCFAYCSILPHDYEFEEKQLILLWMSEGWIPPQPGETKQMEDCGHEYFRELFFRSLFQKSSRNNSKFVMHDLVTDMARWAAGEICFRLDDKAEDNSMLRPFSKARHLSYIYGKYDGVDRFEPISEVIRLRTFLPLSLSNFRYGNYLTRKVTCELLPKLQYARVLSLNGYRITELPDSIGELKQLRYLDLSNTRITSLPESTSNLCNLQTLLLEGCISLTALPKNMRNLINLRHLNNSGLPFLKAMPPQLGRLTNLQSLSNFAVGKGNGLGIREIGSLLHLQGTLELSRLENVIGVEDARSANLNSKERLEALLLEWFDSSVSTDIASAVLDELQPHRNLKELTISGYAGLKFSTWIGDPSFSNMVIVWLVGCNHCQFLPPLGKLPCLKELHIKGMDAVESVGPEFYGEGSLTFPELETLTFEGMKNWKEWFPCQQDRGIGVFSCLKMLSIQLCPKLEGRLPKNLDSLAKLEILHCQELEISLTNYEQLHELRIENCKGVVHTSAVGLTKVKVLLESIDFSNILEFRIQSGVFVKGLSNVKELMITGCARNEDGLPQHRMIPRLHIKNNSSLVEELGKEAEELLQSQMLACKLEYLKLENCGSLLKVPEGLHHLTFLQELHIYGCSSLVSFADIGLPHSLRVMNIWDCKSLMHFARYQIPPSLRRLEISWCANLKSLIEKEEEVCVLSSSCYCLEDLRISNCSSLMSLSFKGQFLRALKHFSIVICRQLESIADKFHDSSCLEVIYIENCPNLKSLPESMFYLTNIESLPSVSGGLALSRRATAKSNLRKISIGNWEKLEVRDMKLEVRNMHSLNSLQELRLDYFEGLTSFLEAGEGFPPNLVSLGIKSIKSCKALLESRGFLRLTSLRGLILAGEGDPDLVSFPPADKEKENEMLLPKSLIRLEINGFPNLKKLSNGFQFLTSLERLALWDCQKLESLPEEGLPHSLSQLQMLGCPLLAERCKPGRKGRYWPKVAHIPFLKIDDKPPR